MTGIQKLIIYLNCLGAGLFAPVLSLFMMERGCDMRSLSIVIGVYSAAVIAFEVPSGMFADMRGRKNAYFVSAALTVASFITLYFSRGLPLLILGMILFGCGAAFLSGSLDSLIIEDCLRRGGDAALPKAAGTMLICQCAGIASGALLCAVLPSGNGYLAHMIARLSTVLAVSVLSAAFLREGEAQRAERRSFTAQARLVISALKGRRALRVVLLCIFGSSICLFALETYWQPRFISILAKEQGYMLGLLCAAGYGGNLLGSFLAGRMKLTDAKGRWRRYLVCIAGFGCALGCLALNQRGWGFILFYIVSMLMLGLANVPEQTILNGEAANENRASLMSVASLSSKLSGVFSSVVCAALVVPLDVTGVWLVMGGFTVLSAGAAAVILKLPAREKAAPAE